MRLYFCLMGNIFPSDTKMTYDLALDMDLLHPAVESLFFGDQSVKINQLMISTETLHQQKHLTKPKFSCLILSQNENEDLKG